MSYTPTISTRVSNFAKSSLRSMAAQLLEQSLQQTRIHASTTTIISSKFPTDQGATRVALPVLFLVCRLTVLP